MRPISNEKRELVIAAKKRGETEKSIAKWLNISERTVSKVWSIYCETGSYLPKPYPGRQPLLRPEKWEEVMELLSKSPDKTLEEIIEELSLPIHKSRLSVLLIEAGYSYKKKLHIQPNKTEKTCRGSEKNLRNR